MEHKNIRDLISLVAETGVTKLNIKTEKFELKIENKSEVIYSEGGGKTVPVVATPILSVNETEKETTQVEDKTEAGYLTITSPMIGTFYRRPSPDKDLFVNVGDTVKVGDTVCIIEAMKLFNEIESEVSGKIVKVLVEDSSPVEYDQPLFLVDPNA